MEPSVDPKGRSLDGPGWRMGLWFALFIAFSPILVDLAHHVWMHPWARGSLIFPLLAWLASQREPVPPKVSTWGWGLVGLGLLIELVAIAGDVLRLGRIGLGIAAVGLCLGAGWATWRVAVLLLWSIPVPHSLLDLEGSHVGPWSSAGPVEAFHWMGLPILFAGLGWYYGLNGRNSASAVWSWGLVFAFVGLLVQFSVSAFLSGHPGKTPEQPAIRFGLELIPWLGVWSMAWVVVLMGNRAHAKRTSA